MTSVTANHHQLTCLGLILWPLTQGTPPLKSPGKLIEQGPAEPFIATTCSRGPMHHSYIELIRSRRTAFAGSLHLQPALGLVQTHKVI